MPRRILCIAIFAAVALIAGGVDARADLTTGLIAHYPFSGNAQDVSGNLNHGTPNATVVLTTDRFGTANSAYQFNGTNSSITVPNSASLSSPTTAITQSAWIMMYGQSHVGSPFSPITMKSATAENAMMYRLYTSATGVGVSYGNWNNGRFSTTALALNQWYFIASVYDGSKIRQYVNGTAVDSVAFSYTIVADSRPLMIGADTPGFFEVFDGKIDDLRIYNRALSPGEIAELAGSTVGVEDEPRVSSLAFSTARPNPSSAGCSVDLALPSAVRVSVVVFDAAGRRVCSVAEESFAAGRHSLVWDGRDAAGGLAPAGLYFMRLQAANEERWTRVVRVR